MKRVTILLCAILLLGACKPKQLILEKEKVVNHTEYRNKIQYDSIYLHDSVLIHKVADTTFVTKWKTTYKYKLRVDTVQNHDSVYIDVPYFVNVPGKKVYVNKQTEWQTVTSFFGKITLILGLLFGIWKFIEWKFLKK